MDAINQLKNSATPNASELSDLLNQLKTIFEAEPNIQLAAKTEAFEQINTLAKAAQQPQDNTLKKLAEIALEVLQSVAASSSNTSDLTAECNKLLPEVCSLLGLG